MSRLLDLFYNQGKGRPIGRSTAVPWYLSGGIASANCVAAWALDEASGATATDATGHGYNGTYVNATLGQTGIGDGKTAISLSGSAGVRGVNVYSAGLASAFNGAEGSISMFFKVSNIADWTDGAERNILYLGADGTNFVYLSKKSQSNKIWFGYQAGGTYDTVDAQYYNATGWVHIAITWSKSADQLKAYLNGVQQGATQTTLGTWAGALASIKCMIGSGQSNADNGLWKGSLARVSLYNVALSEAQIQALATTLYWDGFNGLMISIDDGDESILSAITYAASKGVYGTAYVITDLIDTAGYLTSANLATIDGLGWVVGNHTNTSTVLTTLAEADQETALSAAATALTGWGVTAGRYHVAYPAGGWNADTWTAMAATGMLTGRAGTTTPSCDDPKVVHPYFLGTHRTAASTTTVADFQSTINARIVNGKWANILFHRFVTTGASGNQWTYSNFNTLVDWIASQGIPSRTIVNYYAAR